MGNANSKPSTSDPLQSTTDKQSGELTSGGKPKCKPCCACPDTRKVRDECVIAKGEENCIDLIKAHQDCMREMGFNI